MWSKIHKWLPAICVVLVVLVIVLIVRPLVATHQEPDGQTSSNASDVPSQVASSKPNSSASPSPSSGSTKPGKQEDSSPTVVTCDQVLGTEGYSRFTESIVKYETLYQNQVPSNSFKGIATDLYIAQHSFTATPDAGSVEVEINAQASGLTCTAPTATQLIVVIQPVISTYRGDGADRTMVNGPFTAPSHFTIWVKQGKQWLVDNEY